MLREFRKFKGWVVLEFFLTHPSIKIHFKELTRKLGVSPRTALIYLKTFKNDKILTEEKVGNLTIFSLNNDSPSARALKKTHFLLTLNELGFPDAFKENMGVVSFALYGSYADGSHDEKSDIDFLVIKHGSVDKNPFRRVEQQTKKDVLVTCMSPAEWRRKAKEKDPFYINVVKNHLLLLGADLVVE
jgi:DNA-binding transcriptional ArsR family regulator